MKALKKNRWFLAVEEQKSVAIKKLHLSMLDNVREVI